MRKNAKLSNEEYARDRQGIAERFLPLSSRLAFEIWVRGGKKADLGELKSEAQLALVRASRSWDPSKGLLPVHLACHIKWELIHFLKIQKPSGYRFSNDDAPPICGLTYSTGDKEVDRQIQDPCSFLDRSMDAMQLQSVIRNAHLSPRAAAIMRRFAAGETVAQIAQRFNSYETAIYTARFEAVRLMKDALARAHKAETANRRLRYGLIQKLLVAPIGAREFFGCLPEETPQIARSRIASRLLSDKRGTYFVWSTRAIAGGASVLKLAVRPGWEQRVCDVLGAV